MPAVLKCACVMPGATIRAAMRTQVPEVSW